MAKILVNFCYFILAAVICAQNPDFEERMNLTNGYVPPQSPFVVSGYWTGLNNSPMAVSRTCCVYIVINGTPYLYQFGGGNTSSELRRVARLNLVTNTWQNNYSTMPNQISAGTAIAMNDGTIFVFGGNLSPGSLGRTLRYNTANNTWQTMVNMPTAVTDAFVVKYDESRIIVIGGGDGFFGTSAFITNRVQVYNVLSNTYSYSNNFPISISMNGGGIYRDTVISVGGYTTGGNATANCYKGVINPATMNITWTSMPSYPAGSITRMASYVASRNTGVGIVCTGGAIGGSIPTAQTHFWNFCLQQWMQGLPDNSQARTNFKASGNPLNGSIIYAASGFTTSGVGTTEFITFSLIEGPCQNMVGISGNNSIAEKFELMQNYPNPFNPETKISFSLPVGGLVKIIVSDIQGKEVSEITNKLYTAGNYSVNFSGGNLPSGVYFYTITAGQFKDTKKMLLVK